MIKQMLLQILVFYFWQYFDADKYHVTECQRFTQMSSI